jgi:hypothetical protein
LRVERRNVSIEMIAANIENHIDAADSFKVADESGGKSERSGEALPLDRIFIVPLSHLATDVRMLIETLQYSKRFYLPCLEPLEKGSE